MSEIPPREPSPEEEYQLINAKRIELLTRIAGGRVSAEKVAAYLSDFSPELLANESKLADVAELVEEHLFGHDLAEIKEEDFDRPVADVDNFNESEALEHPAIFDNFQNRVSAIRGIAIALTVEGGVNPRQASWEALLDGLAEWLSLSDEEPPEALRFRVEKFRKKRDAGGDFGTELASDIMEMQGNPPPDLVDHVAESEEIDPRFAERRVDAQTGRIIESYHRHVETAPARAKKILEDYPDLQEPVDIILGIKGEKLPIEIAGSNPK